MLVKQRMTTHPLTILADTPVSEALSFMRQHNIRRLPVIDKKGRMAGIVSEKDLLYASPSPATSLSVYEVGYLLSKLKVDEIMTKKVITVDANAPLEDAARIMIDNKIGGLPVMENEQLVGIITETDVFKALLEMMGAREQGLRVTLNTLNRPGMLSSISGKIAGLGGDIVTLGTFCGEDLPHGIVVLKVRGVSKDVLSQLLSELPDVELLHILDA